jgi:hypothetical protein
MVPVGKPAWESGKRARAPSRITATVQGPQHTTEILFFNRNHIVTFKRILFHLQSKSGPFFALETRTLPSHAIPAVIAALQNPPRLLISRKVCLMGR